MYLGTQVNFLGIGIGLPRAKVMMSDGWRSIFAFTSFHLTPFRELFELVVFSEFEFLDIIYIINTRF